MTRPAEAWAPSVPPFDSPAYGRMRQAGAIVQDTRQEARRAMDQSKAAA